MNAKFGKSESGQALLVTILLLALIVIGMLIVMDGVGHNPFAVITVHAMGGDGRSNGCHTYNVNSIYGGVENEDYVSCGQSPAFNHGYQDSDDYVPGTVNETIPAAVDNQDTPKQNDKPSDKPAAGNPGNHKPVGNAGEDPNGKGTMPLDSTDGNGEHGNQGQNGNKAGEVLGGFIFVTFKKGRKQYQVTVSSWSYSKSIDGKTNHLWLYVWGDDNKNIEGHCGYVPNGKVIATCEAIITNPSVNTEAQEVIQGWND